MFVKNIGVRAPLDLGGGDLIARKNYTVPVLDRLPITIKNL